MWLAIGSTSALCCIAAVRVGGVGSGSRGGVVGEVRLLDKSVVHLFGKVLQSAWQLRRRTEQQEQESWEVSLTTRCPQEGGRDDRFSRCWGGLRRGPEMKAEDCLMREVAGLLSMCDACHSEQAAVFCAADSAALCASCDESIHSANSLSLRHIRTPILHDDMDKASFCLRDAEELTAWSPNNEGEGDSASGFLSFPDEEYDIQYDLESSDVSEDTYTSGTSTSDVSDEQPDQQHCHVAMTTTINVASSNPVARVKLEDDASQNLSPLCGVEVWPAGVASLRPKIEPLDLDTKQGLKICRLRLDYADVLTAWDAAVRANAVEPVVPDCAPAADILKDMDCALVPDLQRAMSEPITTSIRSVPDGEVVAREAKLERYKLKRSNRHFTKQIRYEVRKLNAERRPRIKGRFVKRG
eukprot:jgi/Chlat1/4173/Chrsp27S04235